MSGKAVARVGLLAGYILALLLPPYVFFHDRGGAAFLHGANFTSALQLLFPLLGLYAFTFVTAQVLIATNLRWLKRLWPEIISFHRAEGGFALLFALLHPGFILVGFGLSNYLHLRFVSPDVHWWLLPAYIGLAIMLLTVATATLAWYGRNIPWWRSLHRLNYVVFGLLWLHSWFVGTDTHLPLLRAVWLVYLALAAASALAKYYPKIVHLGHHGTTTVNIGR